MRFAVPLVLAAVASVAAAGRAAEPAELLADIRSTVLFAEGAVALENASFALGPARLDVEHGVFFPARTPGGRTVELVFIGQARFRLDPPDEIEAGQLELFTGRRSLDAPVEQAVLVLTSAELTGELLRGPPLPPELRAEPVARASEVHRAWLARTERHSAGIEAALFKSLVGDSAFGGYIALWCRSHELGDFVYEVDPESVEGVTVASFDPLDVSGWERRRLERHIRLQQRKDRWLGVRLTDLGSWDVWLSAAVSPQDGKAGLGSGFEPEHYDLDVLVQRERMRLEARARLGLVAQGDGRRVVTLDLFRDLVVKRVADGASGRDLFFFRSGGQVLVLLPEPSRAGERFVLEVDYGGRALQWVGSSTFDLQDTSGWYPHCGAIDRATYDVRLRWPRRHDLVASGRRVDGGCKGKLCWERRKLDTPAIAFSFVIGDLVVERHRVGHVDLTMAFNKNVPVRLTPLVRERATETVAAALEFFERTFGPYPLDDLTVVTLPRHYSQSYLGFVTLTDSILEPSTEADWLRDATVAHELAHQWWGNLVGWMSYRDQWLSEATANYATVLFRAHREGGTTDLLASFSADWRESLSRTTIEGRTVESLGPVVLGARLNSSIAHNAYTPIVYRKGAAVLAMLARAAGEERFLEMLRSLLAASSDRALTTKAFLDALARTTDLDLAAFASQYIYGTGIPSLYYEFEPEQLADGSWIAKGSASWLPESRYEYSVLRDAAGRWELEREPRQAAREAVLVVPYQLTLATSADPAAAKAIHRGTLTLHGPRQAFRIASRDRPLDLKLDPRNEILAWFYSATSHPKRVLRYRGLDSDLRGLPAEAETLYRQALAVDPLRPQRNEQQRREDRFEDVRIHLALSRLAVEAGDDARAEGEIEKAEALLESFGSMALRMERDTTRALVEIHGGDYAAASRRLKKTLRLASPAGQRVSWIALPWRLQLGAERAAMTEAYALLAIAAFEIGDRENLMWALGEARDRGVDMSELERLMTAQHPL